MERTKTGQVTAIIILLAGMLMELGFQTFWLEGSDPYVNPFLWLLGGLMTCGAAFYLIGFKKRPAAISLDYYQRYNNALLILSVTLFSALMIGFFLSDIFYRYPSDPMTSDILPSLEAYVRRFLSGEKVYAPIPFPGWTVNPTYFPMMWLPYCFSEWLQMDYRWTAYIIFVIAIYLYNLKIVRQDIPYIESALKALVPFLFLLAFVNHREIVFGYAVELLPVGFYLILTLTIFNQSRFLMAVGILLCLMSRYAFTFWLPIYFLVIWLEWGFRDLLKVGLTVLAGVLLIYVLPFLAKDWTIFGKGLAYYNATAVGQWYTQAWQETGAKPHHLNQGLGFAIYFYDFLEGSVEERLRLNRMWHLIACGIAALMILATYFFYRKKGLNSKIYLIIALKFYLLIFYAFFQVPFSYLYMVPLFLSIAILYNVPFKRGRFISLPNN